MCTNILHYQNNQGRGYALRTGISASKGKYVITTESDLSWGPTIIQNLYEHLVLSKSDIVVASVFHKGGGFENVPIFRRLLSRGGNWLMQRCFESCLTQFSGLESLHSHWWCSPALKILVVPLFCSPIVSSSVLLSSLFLWVL